MLTHYTVKDLYALALAEGEGMGTAYEYFAKRRALAPWLKRKDRPQSMLIAGLPQRYGLSLDFLLLATELGVAVTVIDERPAALERLIAARGALLEEGDFQLAEPETQLVDDLAHPHLGDRIFDLAVASEVLQRLPELARAPYAADVLTHSRATAFFAPNADNAAHTNRSGLSGLHLSDLQELTAVSPTLSGYIDMPPFPPGITRSDDQREQATSGTFESLVMWGLGHYAQREHWVPSGIRQSQSHIVYALTPA